MKKQMLRESSNFDLMVMQFEAGKQISDSSHMTASNDVVDLLL